MPTSIEDKFKQEKGKDKLFRKKRKTLSKSLLINKKDGFKEQKLEK